MAEKSLSGLYLYRLRALHHVPAACASRGFQHFFIMTFSHLGKAAEIGANSYVIDTGDARIVLDAGMHPKREGMDAVPEFRSISEEHVDAIIVTHSHLDHSGTLPVVQRDHPEASVFMTPPTRALVDALLHNSSNVMSSKGQELGIREYPLFGHKEIERLAKKWSERDYERPFELDDEGTVRATFYDAGHILGSAGVLLETEDKTVFYTGDVQFEDQALIKGADFPEEGIDTLIIETTRGAYERPEDFTREAEELRFMNAMADGLRKGGSVLVPVFAMGKTQEVLTMIHLAKERGILDANVPVFIGGLSTKMSYIFDEFANTTRRKLPGFELFQDMDIEVGSRRKRTPITYQPGAIYALSSGMMSEKTVSNIFARSFLPNRQNQLLFVGYTDPSTPGYAVKMAKPGEQVSLDEKAEPVKLNCDVKTFDFSGHAVREDLLDYILRVNPQKCLLVHGDMPAMEWFRDQLAEKAPQMDVAIPAPGETHDL